MKALHDRVWAQIARFMANEASEEDRQAVTKLLMENEVVAQWYRELTRFYETKEEWEEVDPTPAFEKLEEKIKVTVYREPDWYNF
jgi:hypothetical protein